MLLVLLTVPLFPAALTALVGWRRPTSALQVVSATALVGVAVSLAVRVLDRGVVRFGGGALRADPLAAFMVLVVSGVALLATWSAVGYIAAERASGRASETSARLFGSLLPVFVATMLFALVAGNAAVSWVAVEGTTIATAFLVGHRRSRTSLEASWKYVIIGSVGIALAFLGTIVLAHAAGVAGAGGAGALDWERLVSVARDLDPATLRLAGGLLLLGYGTKVGLVPMHTWLPDAHSQAPAPVSALMSGVLLSVAFSVFLRMKVVVDVAVGAGFLRGLLLAAALLSLGVAASLMIGQRDAKRLLAYSSIEHMGFLAFAAAIGTRLAAAALLLHVVAHALGKSVAFLAVGELPLTAGTTRIAELRGLLAREPALGTCIALATLALMGLPPFGLFASEVAVARAGFEADLGWQTAVVLVVLAIATGALSYQSRRLLLGSPGASGPSAGPRATLVAPVVTGLVALAALGVTIWPLQRLIDAAAQVVAP